MYICWNLKHNSYQTKYKTGFPAPVPTNDHFVRPLLQGAGKSTLAKQANDAHGMWGLVTE